MTAVVGFDFHTSYCVLGLIQSLTKLYEHF